MKSSSRKLKVLYILASLNRGGAETFVVNLLRNIDSSLVDVSFLLSYHDGDYENEVKEKGGRIFYLPHVRDVGPRKLANKLKVFFSRNQFDVVHSHIGESSFYYLNAAKNSKVSVRICHAHSVSDSNNYLVKLYKSYLRNKLKKCATHLFACSNEAGKRLFGTSSFKIVNNAIDLAGFESEDLSFQQSLKEKYNINPNDVLIGHVGRFEKVKNHHFLIDVFYEMLKTDKGLKLVLVGIGPLKQEVESYVNDLGISSNVIFLGIQESMVNIYRIFDAFLFTSLFESFGIVLLEAQICGCNVICPSHITKEVDLNVGLVSYLDLDKGKEFWGAEVLKKLKEVRDEKSIFYLNQASEKGFDAVKGAESMISFYYNAIN